MIAGLLRWLRFLREVWWPPVPEVRNRRTPAPSKFQMKAKRHD